MGDTNGIRRFGEVLTAQKIRRGKIPVTMRPGANPEDIYFYFTVKKWIDLPQVIEIKDSFRGKPQFTNKFLLDHCTQSYQLFAISSEEEYRLIAEINKAFDNLSAAKADNNTAVYYVNDTHSVIVADGCFTITNNNGEILGKIPVSTFARRPRTGFKKIKSAIG